MKAFLCAVIQGTMLEVALLFLTSHFQGDARCGHVATRKGKSIEDLKGNCFQGQS